MPQQRYLTMADVAALLDVKPETISVYRARSKPGKTYAEHPFPEPDDTVGQSPVWFPERAEEIKRWASGRRGPGRFAKGSKSESTDRLD